MAVLLVSPLQAATDTSAVTFTKKPAAVKTADGVKVDFAVSGPTDVAVYIEDASQPGKVVRHLVAGVLGKNPPPPLKANSLEQSIVWDGKDDCGKTAAGGPFKARVRLGLTASLDRLVQAPNSQLEEPNALGVGPGGEVYVLTPGGWPANMWVAPRMFVLDRINRRIVVVKLTYAAEKACDVQ